MADRKTCGACGSNGGLCEWAVDSVYENKVCKNLRGEYVRDTNQECELHLAYRQQRERAEAAEKRIVVMEGALKMCAGATDCGGDDVCALYKIESIVSIALEASDD